MAPFHSPCRRPRSFGPIVSYSAKRHARQGSTQHSKRQQDTGKSSNTSAAIRDTQLSPLDGCPISSGQRDKSGGLLCTSFKSWPSQYGFTINGLSQSLSRANTTAHDLSIRCHWVDGDWKSGPKKGRRGSTLIALSRKSQLDTSSKQE